MKKFLRVTLKTIALLLVGGIVAISARAQYIGQTSPLTTNSTPFSGTTCGVAQKTALVPNNGQTSHYAYIFPSPVTTPITMSVTIQGSNDGVNFVDISEQGTYPLSSETIFGTGYYSVVRVAVLCSPSNATYTIFYSGTSVATALPLGSQHDAQLLKEVAIQAPANATLNQGVSFRTPFGTSNSTIYFAFTGGAGPAGSTLTVQCSAAEVNLLTVSTFALQTTNSLQQVFQVPSVGCDFMFVNYSSGGASTASFDAEVSYTPPGTPNSSTQYAHVAGTTATAVKGMAGFLHTLTVNTGGAGTISLFDLPAASCTGTPATNTVAIVTATATTLQTFTYDANFLQGICAKASVAMDFTASFN